jgi:cytoskeletal protein CcmA (bactofilin family)
MANTRFKGPVYSANGLNIGSSGSTIKQIKYGTVAVDPASLAAAASAETAVTISGVAAGDLVIMAPPASLESDLCYSGCRVSAANTVQLRLSNIDNTNAVDGDSRTWEYIWIDLT